MTITRTIIDIIILNKKGTNPVYKLKDAVWAIVILAVIIPVFIVIAATGLFAVGDWYSEKYILPEQTNKEGRNIVAAIVEFSSSHGCLPEQIVDLTTGFPIRAGWLQDSWGEPYHYEKMKDGTNFKLISKGPDRVLATMDDLIFR